MFGIELLLSDARGVYIPRDFALYIEDMDNVTTEDKEILSAGPDHEWYWESLSKSQGAQWHRSKRAKRDNLCLAGTEWSR